MKKEAFLMSLAVYEITSNSNIDNLTFYVDSNNELFEDENLWVEELNGNPLTKSECNLILKKYNIFKDLTFLEVLLNSSYVKTVINNKATSIGFTRNIDEYMNQAVKFVASNFNPEANKTSTYREYIAHLTDALIRWGVPKDIVGLKSEYVNTSEGSFRREFNFDNKTSSIAELNTEIIHDTSFFRAYCDLNKRADTVFIYGKKNKFFASVTSLIQAYILAEIQVYLYLCKFNILINNPYLFNENLMDFISSQKYGFDVDKNKLRITLGSVGGNVGNQYELKNEKTNYIPYIGIIFYLVKKFIFEKKYIFRQKEILNYIYEKCPKEDLNLIKSINSDTLICICYLILINIQLEYIMRDTEYTFFDICPSSLRVDMQTKFIGSLSEFILEYDNPYLFYERSSKKISGDIEPMKLSEEVMGNLPKNFNIVNSYQIMQGSNLLEDKKDELRKIIFNIDKLFEENKDLIEFTKYTIEELKVFYTCDLIQNFYNKDVISLIINNEYPDLKKEDYRNWALNILKNIPTTSSGYRYTTIFKILVLKYFIAVKELLKSAMNDSEGPEFTLKSIPIQVDDWKFGTIESDFADDLVLSVTFMVKFKIKKSNQLISRLNLDLIKMFDYIKFNISSLLKSFVSSYESKYDIIKYLDEPLIIKAISEDYLTKSASILDNENLEYASQIPDNSLTYRDFNIIKGRCYRNINGKIVINYQNKNFNVSI